MLLPVARRLAFVGLSGPIGYDYQHSTGLIDPRDSSSPNPVLENVSGLLLCYEDIYFLSRHFCPSRHARPPVHPFRRR